MKTLIQNFIVCFLVMAVSAVICIAGDSNIENIKKKLPKMLGANNAGTGFWISVPPSYQEGNSAQNFIKIFVTSPYASEVKVSIPGRGFEQIKNTIPDEVIEFNLPFDIAQPVIHRPNKIPLAETVYTGAGIHIEAQAPVVAYCVVRAFANSDGFLAYPVTSIGSEYIVASYNDMGAMYNGNYPSEVTIISPYDNNEVTFTLGGNIMTKTAGGMNPGETATKVLNKGDVWLFSSFGNNSDLTGSKIVSSLPVGVVYGNFCANIPADNRWCDYTVEMDVPVYTWGTNLHVPKLPNRKYPSILRIFAKEPDTRIYRDNIEIAHLIDGGGMQNKGWMELRAVPLVDNPRPVLISGNKTIGVTLYNTGMEEDGYVTYLGDPFVMSVTPLEQYQNEIEFCTPGIYGGLGFLENYLNIIYELDLNGNIPEDLEYASVKNGEFQWEKVRDKFPGAGEPFVYNFDQRQFAAKTIMLPGDGVYKLKATKPFAAYSFGYSPADSYGYPTAAATMVVGKIDAQPPEISCSMGTGINTGTFISGTVWDLPNDPANKANLSIAFFHQNESFNYEFKIDDFIPGEDKTVNWELNVIDKAKDAYAFLTFADKKGNDTTVFFEYKAARLDVEDSNPGEPVNSGSITSGGSINISEDGGNIDFYLEKGGFAEVSLYSQNGNLLLKPVSGIYEAGMHSFRLDCSGLAAGTYIMTVVNESTRSSALIKLLK